MYEGRGLGGGGAEKLWVRGGGGRRPEKESSEHGLQVRYQERIGWLRNWS